MARHLPKRPGDGHGSECDQAHVALRVALGEEACNAAWAAGPAMPLDEAIALALASQAEPWQGP